MLPGGLFDVIILSNGATWIVQRSLNDFLVLDRQIHRCVFNREYSELPELATIEYQVCNIRLYIMKLLIMR